MIVNKDDEERTVTLPVLIPDYDDCDAPIGEEQLSVKQIANFAYKYLEKYRLSDPGHTYIQAKKEAAVPVASWLLPEDTAMKTLDGEETTYPEGTWMVTLKVHDDEAWENVKNGTYTGGSVTVMNEDEADKLVGKSAATKGRVLIKDISEPVAATIALVEKPCVRDAKFCSVKDVATKSAKEESYEDKKDKIRVAVRNTLTKDSYIELTFDDKVIYRDYEEETYYEVPYSINVNDEVELGEPVEVEQEFVAKKMLEIAVAEKEGRRFSNSTYNKLKNAWDSLGKLMDKANDEMKQIDSSSKSDNMTKTDNKENNNEYVTKSDLDEALENRFKEQETNIVEAVKAANETEEEKKKKEIEKIKKELKELGVDTSEMDFSTKEEELEENEETTVSKKEYDEVVEKNKEYAEQLGIEVESQSLKEKDNDKTATKSDSERIMDSMNQTKEKIKNE